MVSVLLAGLASAANAEVQEVPQEVVKARKKVTEAYKGTYRSALKRAQKKGELVYLKTWNGAGLSGTGDLQSLPAKEGTALWVEYVEMTFTYDGSPRKQWALMVAQIPRPDMDGTSSIARWNDGEKDLDILFAETFSSVLKEEYGSKPAAGPAELPLPAPAGTSFSVSRTKGVVLGMEMLRKPLESETRGGEKHSQVNFELTFPSGK